MLLNMPTLFPPLHPPTLMVVTALAIAFSGGLLMSVRRPGSKSDVALIWGASMLTGAFGFIVGAVGHDIPWIGDGVSTALFLSAVSLSWVGARAFSERLPLPWLAVAGPLLWVASLPLQSLTWPSAGPFWAATAFFIGTAYSVGVVAELGRERTEYLPSRQPALILMAVHAAIYAARGMEALLGVGTRLWSEHLVVGLTLEALLHSIGMTFLLLAMMKERIELRSTEQLRTLARQDGLTGIANRRHFDEQLPIEMRQAARLRQPISLLMIDVDHFKRFNDACGHQQGDACLIAVAQALAGSPHRPRDLVARYGGEEFVVLMPETDLAGALHVAEAARKSVEALGMVHPGPSQVVTISIGAASSIPDDSPKSGRLLVHSADAAMYEAKAAGRNAVRSAETNRMHEFQS